MRHARRALTAALLAVGVVSSVLSLVAIPAAAASPRPVVTGLSAHSGVADDTVRVVVTGRHLGSVSSVFFGSQKAVSVLPLSTTRVQAFARPTFHDRTVSVRVRARGRNSAVTARARYTFVLPPVLTRLTPAGSLPAGRRVTVVGRDFRAVRSVTFGGTPGTAVRVASSSVLTVTAPRHAVGVAAVRVRTAYGITAPTTYPGDPSDPGLFRYAAAPTVTGVEYVSGPVAGGDEVQVTGTGLAGATSVTFGSTAVRVDQHDNDSQIYAKAPAHAAGFGGRPGHDAERNLRRHRRRRLPLPGRQPRHLVVRARVRPVPRSDGRRELCRRRPLPRRRQQLRLRLHRGRLGRPPFVRHTRLRKRGVLPHRLVLRGRGRHERRHLRRRDLAGAGRHRYIDARGHQLFRARVVRRARCWSGRAVRAVRREVVGPTGLSRRPDCSRHPAMGVLPDDNVSGGERRRGGGCLRRHLLVLPGAGRPG